MWQCLACVSQAIHSILTIAILGIILACSSTLLFELKFIWGSRLVASWYNYHRVSALLSLIPSLEYCLEE